MHLNPVRIKALGLSQGERQAQRVGLAPASDAKEVRERIRGLRAYRWSSYMVLYLGRRMCGLTLRELAQAVGLRNYAVVATNTKRYAQRLQSDPQEQARLKQVSQLLNCEM